VKIEHISVKYTKHHQELQFDDIEAQTKKFITVSLWVNCEGAGISIFVTWSVNPVKSNDNA